MRVLSLLLALPSAAGLVGPELLNRLGPARGVVPAPSRRRAHVGVLAAARGAAPTIGESQQQLHAVQRNASCLSGAARPREDPCDGAEWWDRGAQSRSVTPPPPPTSPSEMIDGEGGRHCSIYPLGSLSSVHLDPVPCLLCPPPMNTPVREGETIEGSRTMRNRPYPVLKCSSCRDVERSGAA